MALIALTREVSAAFASCQLTHLARVPIDVERARAQHAAYEHALERLGCVVHRLPSTAAMPDAVFIEDVAIVLPPRAVLTRPGSESRRLEVEGVRAAVEVYRPVAIVEPPATLDGGDVLVMGRTIFVGVSGRTNREGVEQLRGLTAADGYDVQPVRVSGCLHLKSAVTALSNDQLLVNPAWVEPDAFAGYERIAVDRLEPYGANAVRIGAALVYPTAYPRTRDRLSARGFDVHAVDVSELAKAEGAVTCCSLIFEGP